MLVIFLDFDGVLNTDTDVVDESDELWSASWLETHLVERLARLVRLSGARVVISSSWRQRHSREELQRILAEHSDVGEIFDVTPRHPRLPDGERFVRRDEIAAWLAAHPDVTRFVILDDDADFGVLAAHHVHVDAKVGLTDADVERAVAILHGIEVQAGFSE